MGADLLLEREHLAVGRVVEGVDHDVRGVREGVGAAHDVGGAGAERGQGARVVVEVVQRDLRAVRAEHDPAVAFAADQQEADAGVVGEGRQQRGMPGVDLLLGHAVRHVRERHQAEVAGGEHDRLGAAGGPEVLRALLDGPAQRGADRRAGLGAAVGAPGAARHGQPAAGPHQVAEGEAVAGAEGLAGALPVVGQHDDPVRAGRVLGDVLDQGERAVEPAQHLLGVAAGRPGVVGDLVVGDQVGVDGAASGQQVAHHGGRDDVPFDDGGEGAHQRVQPAAGYARTLRSDPGAHGLADLPAHLGDEGQGGAHGVGRVGEVGEVAGAGAGGRASAAGGDGQHQSLFPGAAAEEVAAAGAVLGEQSRVAGALDRAGLELGGAGGPVADHHLVACLLVPAEGGDVEVAAVQDAELAGAGLAGPVGAPGGEAVGGPVAAGAQPAGDGGHQALVEGGEQDVVADAVELDEHRAGGGRAGRVGAPSAVRQPVQAPAVGVVVTDGEGASGGGGDGGHHGGDHHGGLGGRRAALDRVDAQRHPQQGAVEEEHQQAEDEGGHEQQQPHQERPDQRGQQAEGARAERGGDSDVGGAAAVGRPQPEVRQDAREDQHGERGDRPHGDTPPDLTGDLPPSPVTHAAHTSHSGP